MMQSTTLKTFDQNLTVSFIKQMNQFIVLVSLKDMNMRLLNIITYKFE